MTGVNGRAISKRVLKVRRKPGETWSRKDGSHWTKLSSGAIVPAPEQQQTGMFGESEKLPPDLKTKKARELKASDWGTPDEVAEMAKTPRTVKNRYEAQQALENIISGNGRFQRTVVPLKSKSGLTAYLRRSSIGKLVSTSQKKEMPEEALWTAAANIDKLYANAIEPWRFAFNEDKNNEDLKARRILYAPMEFHERIIPVMFTVKEYHNEETDRKLYAVEAINFDIVKKAKIGVEKNRVASGQLKVGVIAKKTALNPCRKDATHGVLNLGTCVSPPTSSYAPSIPNIFDEVNSYLIRKRRLQMILEQLQVLKARRSPGETWSRKDGSHWTKLSSGAIVPVPEQRQTGMFGEEQAAVMAEEAARKTCVLLTNVLESGKSATVQNKDLGEITVDAGHTGKSGYGLRHIIEQRFEEGKNKQEISALLLAIIDSAKNGKITREIKFKRMPDHRGRIELEKNGIIAVVSRQRLQGDGEQWLLTGFDDENKEAEATDTIKAIYAQYSYAPEFSGYQKQVGAVVASLAVSHKAVNKSREQAIRIIKVWLKAYKLYERERYGTAP